MNRQALIFLVVAFVISSAESRKCRYLNTYKLCEKQCCGKEDNLTCKYSCVGESCSSDQDCGTSCCSGGECADFSCALWKIIIPVVTILGLILLCAIMVLCRMYYRRGSVAHPGFVVIATMTPNRQVPAHNDSASLVNNDELNSMNPEYVEPQPPPYTASETPTENIPPPAYKP